MVDAVDFRYCDNPGPVRTESLLGDQDRQRCGRTATEKYFRSFGKYSSVRDGSTGRKRYINSMPNQIGIPKRNDNFVL